MAWFDDAEALKSRAVADAQRKEADAQRKADEAHRAETNLKAESVPVGLEFYGKAGQLGFRPGVVYLVLLARREGRYFKPSLFSSGGHRAVVVGHLPRLRLVRDPDPDDLVQAKPKAYTFVDGAQDIWVLEDGSVWASSVRGADDFTFPPGSEISGQTPLTELVAILGRGLCLFAAQAQ